MRGTAVDPGEYAFQIVTDHGIVLLSPDNKSVVVEEPSFQGLEFFQLPKE
jgi:hypothetical protein